jgi:hypothetical protein
MGKALTAVLSALRWLMAHPWQAACIGLVCVSAWQYAAIGRLNGRLVQREAVITRQNALIAEMQAKAEQARAKSVTIAKDADNEHKERAKVSLAATDNFVSRNRLPAPKASVSAPEAVEGAGNVKGPATEAVMVAVSEADVRICAANYDYARTAFDWTQGLIREGLGD